MRPRPPALAAVALLLAFALTGCAAPVPSWDPAPAVGLDAADRAALAGVPDRAAEAVGVRDPDAVDCWLPSAHPVDPAATVLGSDEAAQEAPADAAAPGPAEAAFRVLCRVSFAEAGESRWRDAICLGDPARSPAVAGCYMWAYYEGAPGFPDEPAVRLPIPAAR